MAVVENLSIAVFARRLGISERTVWRMLSAGVLESRRIGGRRLIPSSEAERIMAMDEDEAHRFAERVACESRRSG